MPSAVPDHLWNADPSTAPIVKNPSYRHRGPFAIINVSLPIPTLPQFGWSTDTDVYEYLLKSHSLRRYLIKKAATMFVTNRIHLILLTHDLMNIPLVLSPNETEEDLQLRVGSRLITMYLENMGLQSESSDSFFRMFERE